MCATGRIMRSKSARSSRRERQGQAQAHRARPQSEGAGEGAAQDATAQGAQVREALSATGEASGPDGGRLKFWDGRSEERRVGKECRSRWAPCNEREKDEKQRAQATQ